MFTGLAARKRAWLAARKLLNRQQSRTGRRVRVQEDRIQRRRAANEQAIEFPPAEAHIGDGLGDSDLAKQRPIARVAVDAVAGRQPKIAMHIDAEAVE